MDSHISDYLDTLGLTEAMRFRVDSLVANYEALLQQPLVDVVISEYISDDVGRVFESMWGFTDKLIMEAKIPSDDEGDQFDFVPLRRSVRHWVVRTKDFRPGSFTDTSRLSIEVWLADERVGRLRATGRNCDQMMSICLERILPNLASLAAEQAPVQEGAG